jgi:hypothetical protein
MATQHIGRIVTISLVGGLVVALALVVGPFAGAQEHVIRPPHRRQAERSATSSMRCDPVHRFAVTCRSPMRSSGIPSVLEATMMSADRAYGTVRTLSSVRRFNPAASKPR